MTLIINLVGLFLITVICWFFFMKKESSAVFANSELLIIVEGGYRPDVIKLKKGKPVKLIFLRKDPSSCLEEVVLKDFKITQYLTLNKKVEIDLIPEKEGIYNFSCGMNMFHGKLIVEN